MRSHSSRARIATSYNPKNWPRSPTTVSSPCVSMTLDIRIPSAAPQGSAISMGQGESSSTVDTGSNSWLSSLPFSKWPSCSSMVSCPLLSNWEPFRTTSSWILLPTHTLCNLCTLSDTMLILWACSSPPWPPTQPSIPIHYPTRHSLIQLEETRRCTGYSVSCQPWQLWPIVSD